MANDIIFPKGLMVFKPSPKAPSFIKASVVISVDEFHNWLQELDEKYVTKYNGKDQVKFTITESKDGSKLNIAVDTFKPDSNYKKDSSVNQTAASNYSSPEESPF